MYHISNLGKFGKNVEQFADHAGYVPQEGDKFESMNYDALWHPDEDEWGQHVASAVAATNETNEDIAKWQKENA